MPKLFILAGPNGAGKTTFYYSSVNKGYINPALPFINVDFIAREELGGYSEENFFKATEIARVRIGEHLAKKEDFMIESNLARSADYDWIINMKKAGYEVILYFLCTIDLLINIDRIERRVKEGGHYIPPHIVTDRYNMCMLYLKTKLHLFKEIYFIDNTEEVVKEVASVVNGVLQFETDDIPEWVNNLLFFIKR